MVSPATNSLVHTIPVGNNPVAMAETPDTKKLYVANHDDSTISGFNTLDRSARVVNGSFSAPLWVTARSDSQRLYVLNGNGVVSTLDITSTAGPDAVIDASVNAPGAAYMLYDANKNRLYLPGGSQLTILDVSQSIPAVLTAPIAIPTIHPIRAAPVIPAPALDSSPDGCRHRPARWHPRLCRVVLRKRGRYAYVCPQVTVIDVASNAIKTSLRFRDFLPTTPYAPPPASA